MTLTPTLAALALSLFILGILWACAASRLSALEGLTAAWIPLVAAAAVALAGYGAVWIYFASPTLGRVFSVLAAAAAAADLIRRGPRSLSEADIALPAILVGLVVVFYIALLGLYSAGQDFFTLAADRWLALPLDNTLPHNFARHLYEGTALRNEPGGWLSSDRPPLASGWLLLTWPFGAALGLDQLSVGATSAVLFQSTWIFAAFAMFRTLGLSTRRAGAWTALLCLCGFFIQNTLFTWPKLSSGAFACGAFFLWFLPGGEKPGWGRILAGAALAALAWLSHGGAAFSLIALAPWAAVRMRRDPLRWLAAGVLCLALASPWLAYQRFYDPPGNRLLKWHLAGQIDVDGRTTWQALRDGYAAMSARQILAVRASNLSRLVAGDWSWWWDYSTAKAEERRAWEFFDLARALTWWLLGFTAVPFAWGFLRRSPTGGAAAALAGWIGLSLVVWCGLLFLPNNAVVHQGPYALPLALFVVLSVVMEAASRWSVVAVAALQLGAFASTWIPHSKLVHGALSTDAVALLAAALVALGCLFVKLIAPR